MAESILAGDIRNGITFEYNNQVYVVVNFQHVKPGKGAAFVRTKIRNVINGGVIEVTFSPTDKFNLAHIEKKKMQYSYSDGELYYFMDNETYDMLALEKDLVEEALHFVVEEMEVTVSFYNGAPFTVEPPNFVKLKITVCEMAVRGNTAQSGTKPATLETGYSIQVPMFVNEGDVIEVDTRNGTYMRRV